jgi:hypothetical protein
MKGVATPGLKTYVNIHNLTALLNTHPTEKRVAKLQHGNKI